MLVVLLLITQIQAISMHCNPTIEPPPILPGDDGICPMNSHCLSNDFCACDGGFVGGCSQPAFEMQDGTRIATSVYSNNYTFFSVRQEVDTYVILIFQICHAASSSNFETMDVWEDKGTIDILDKSNAIAGGKDWEVKQGCMKLTTPLLLFERQLNGLPETFIIGIKLTEDGQIPLTLRLEIDTIDFWDLFIKFIFIIGGIFLLIFVIAIAVFIFKWRRRGLRPARVEQNDISHFSNFMPRYKLSQSDRYRTHEESCAVCLLELGEDEWLRKTVCNHVFHQDCIDEWCRTNLTCPICRRSFELKDCATDQSTTEEMSRNGLRNPLMEQG